MQGYTYFFLFFVQHLDCGYSLERVPTIFVLSNNNNNNEKKKRKIKLMEFSIFPAEKNLCLLHGQVFVMDNEVMSA